MSREIEARAIRKRSIPVISYRTHDPSGILPEGSICILLARSSTNQLLQDIAAGLGCGADVRPLLRRVALQFKDRRAISSAEALKLFKRQPVISEVRYSDKSLAGNLVVPEGLEVLLVVCPYNGGRVSPHAFTLVEHVKPDEITESMDAVIIEVCPSMTPAEEAAIRQIPSEQIEGSIGKNIEGAFEAAFFIFASAVVLGWYMAWQVNKELERQEQERAHGHMGQGEGAHVQNEAATGRQEVALDDAANQVDAEVDQDADDAGDDQNNAEGEHQWLDLGAFEHLSDAEVRTLGPAASARELLIRRRELLTRGVRVKRGKER